MVIRGPVGHRPDQAGLTPSTSPLREQATSPLQRLVDFGMAKTPQDAVRVLREIVAALAGAGFPVPKTGSPEQQLQASLRSFQQSNGLPVTGKLDEATAHALEQQGLTPRSSEATQAVAGQPAGARDVVDHSPRPGLDPGRLRFGVGGEGSSSATPTQKGRTIETDQAAARGAQQRPDVEIDLKSMLNAMRMAGFAGAGRGKEQLTDAVKKLQRVDGLPVTGKIDGQTAEALLRRNVLDSATAQVLKEQDPNWAPPSPSTPASSSSDDVRARGEGAGAGGEVAGDSAGRGSVHSGDQDGASDDIGNTYTGDDDDDDVRRDHANRDDVDGHDFEHWEMPRLALQIEDAFAAIVRDDDGVGPATYGWELHLHRPGIYSARQPAEEILKLVVTRAGPFDPVWHEALAALNDRLVRFDHEADPVGAPRLKVALQRARYR